MSNPAAGTSPTAPAAAAITSLQLTRQLKADAIRNVRELLSEVRTDWAYTPPRAAPAPAPLTRSASTASTFSRSGVLGAWRPASSSDSPDQQNEEEAEDSWDDDWNSTDASSSSSDSDDLDDAPRRTRLPQRAVSYRRPSTPPPTTPPLPSNRRHKRKRHRRENRRTGTWQQRIDDSDYEIPSPASAAVGGFRWDSPASLSPRRARRRHTRESMRENPGLRTWLRRRDQWTGADTEGWVPAGRSRFGDNPLAKMVTPNAYLDIYQRCVVRGADLPVPVNLKNMIEALVVGWKSDDLWPPRPAPPERPLVVQGRGAGGEDGGKSMSGRVRKYLGIR